MIRIQLPDPDRDRLQAESRATTDRKYRDRLQIVLMADRGRRPTEIATDPGGSTRTTPRRLNAHPDRGLDGLRPRKAKGAAPKIPGTLAAAVRQWVIGGPAAAGLDRASWTYAGRADRLYKTHGIAAGRSAVRRFCRQLGTRVYRPTSRLLRAAPAEQATARAERADLNRGRRPAGSSCCAGTRPGSRWPRPGPRRSG